VASRWRIRHKLLLGLGLVVLLMAVLLSGTLRGLLSYYTTTNSIRAKLQELFAAEQLKSSVGELISPENTARMVKQHAIVPAEIRKVRVDLVAYSDQLEETLAHNFDSRRGLYERSVVAGLHNNLDLYQKAIDECISKPRRAENKGDETQGKNEIKELAEPRKTLSRGSVDLRDDIKKELDLRLYATRSHYQVALWIVVPASVIGLLLLAGLMRSFYAWVLAPIRDLDLGVKRVAEGDLSHRIDLHSGDEMEDLARAFNDMVGRLQEVYSDLERQVNDRSRQLVRSERLASVGFLAAGVAHEINNPLASIAFCSEALEARLESLSRYLKVGNRACEEQEIFAKYLKMIQDEAFRCKHITERLLEFSRTGEPRRDPTDLRGLVQAVLDVTQHLTNHKAKQIQLEVPPERMGRISAWVNGEEIKSVVLNLVVNALESMDDGGKLTIRLSARDGRAELRFTDTGCGMSREVQDNIFEPFYTRSRTGKGTGLGLTISHLIISQHGGEIEATSPGLGQGSTFVVRLPTQPVEPVGDGPAAISRDVIPIRAA
jgi:two-component system, NtrC family, sensor kinase